MKYQEKQIELPPIIVDRAEGVHVKEIINRMAYEWGITDYGAPGEDKSKLEEAAQLGLAWEHWMRGRLADAGVLVGKVNERLTAEDIWCTPDGLESILSDTNTIRKHFIHEFKVKWIGVDKYPFEDNKWWDTMAQIKAYCHVWETNYAVLHVLYVNGDYKFKNTVTGFPCRRHYKFQFTDQELHENWQSIINFAKSKGLIDGNNR